MKVLISWVIKNTIKQITLPLYQKVDCEWEEWNIGYCSKPCGGGSRINYREKIKEENFGGICQGKTDMEEECNTQPCPGK